MKMAKNFGLSWLFVMGHRMTAGEQRDHSISHCSKMSLSTPWTQGSNGQWIGLALETLEMLLLELFSRKSWMTEHDDSLLNLPDARQIST